VPELPEVEAVARDLRRALASAVIEGVTVHRWDVIDGAGRRCGALRLGGGITGVLRHGKQLALVGKDGSVLVVQLGMTGEFGVVPGRAPMIPHTHACWDLDGGRHLRFVDPRRFGGLTLLDGHEALAERWARLGPDALSLPAQWGEAIIHRRTAIKAALLDQGAVAGVGNIYADEALALAGIQPARPCRKLSKHDVAKLRSALCSVLRAALRSGGSTVRTYRRLGGGQGAFQAKLRVYGRSGQPCLGCGMTLRSAQVVGRTTVWCPTCQT
jgi:formamidopyrimidine-DNA glycosylase